MYLSFVQFEVENILKIFLNLHGIQGQLHKYLGSRIFPELLEDFPFSTNMYFNVCRVCPTSKMASESVKSLLLVKVYFII